MSAPTLALEPAPRATLLATDVVAPAPSAMLLMPVATAPRPKATLLALLDTAFGPIAVLSVPSALLSGSVLLVWKYLAPVELIVLMPVDKELIPLFDVLRPVDALVERLVS